MERTMISRTGLRSGTALLAFLALAGCSKDRAVTTPDVPGPQAVILSIAEVNYGVSGGGSKSARSVRGGSPSGSTAGDGATYGAAADNAPQTRAIVDGGSSTFFTDGDRLGLFLRGEGYEDIDNRIVQLDYPGEGPRKRWNITGPEITLYDKEATVTAYFPYDDTESLTMSSLPLYPGPYDVDRNDLVWQRDHVHSTHTQAIFLDMQHALTRVKIRLSKNTAEDDPGTYPGTGKIMGVQIADAEDVPESDRVVYFDGTFDLTQAAPVVTPGVTGAVLDMTHKTLTEEGVLYDLLLLPVEEIAEGKLMLHVVIDDKLISTPFPAAPIDRWEAGQAYLYDVFVRNGDAQVVFGKATVTPWNYGGSIDGDLDTSKPEYGGGDVQDWNADAWEYGKMSVGMLWGGGVIYWVNPDDETDYRIVALDEPQFSWAASSSYVLGSGAQDMNARNGADVWEISKLYSEAKTNGATGTFATDFPAFSYCYEKTDGGVSKGTWYLPSLQELKDLYTSNGTVEPVITSNGGTAFLTNNAFWSATENSSAAKCVVFSNGGTYDNNKIRGGRSVRCVRGKNSVKHRIKSASTAAVDFATARAKCSGSGMHLAVAADWTMIDQVIQVWCTIPVGDYWLAGSIDGNTSDGYILRIKNVSNHHDCEILPKGSTTTAGTMCFQVAR